MYSLKHKVIFLLFLKYVMCQVCSETRSVFQEVPETYRFTYIETYEEPCVIFCSVKTRTAVNVSSRIVQRYENITMNVCCEGYIQDDSHKGNGLFCKPICNPFCQNGYCKKPNECACEAGYALDPLDSHVCKPLCLKDCDIPYCISTKTPQCFSNDTEVATPVCTEPCINAICVAAGVCKCLPGYHETSANMCEPYNYPCDHGTLVATNTCECDDGFQWKCGSCQPVCFECDYGTCISPGECQCNNGYAKSDKGKCEPYCSTGCANGTCISPEICSCNPGWYMITSGGECYAHCDMNCDNGHCIAPNVCECDSGYQLDRSNQGPRCVLSRKDCEDYSYSNSEVSKTCKCEASYEVSYLTDDGGDCDCFDNCSDINNKCTQSICVFNNEVVATPEEVDQEEAKITDRIHFTTNTEDVSTSLGTLSSTEKIEETKTVLNSRKAFSKASILPAHWIYGIVTAAVLMVLLLLGFMIKRKYCKTHSQDKNDDVILHYMNNKLS